VLEDLGYSASDVAALFDAKVVFDAQRA